MALCSVVSIEINFDTVHERQGQLRIRNRYQITHLEQTFPLVFPRDRFSEILNEKEYWAFVSQMAEIIQPEGVDMLQMDLVHIHAVLRNSSYDMESLMRRVSACICCGRRRN